MMIAFSIIASILALADALIIPSPRTVILLVPRWTKLVAETGCHRVFHKSMTYIKI